MTSASKKRFRRTIYAKNEFEARVWVDNSLMCGIDEVGRGCLAGPVVAAAVVLPPGSYHEWLRDSKEMTPEQRKQAYQWIVAHAWYGIGAVHNRIIDQYAIWQATMLAMKRAFNHVNALCPQKIHLVAVDAMPLELPGMPVYFFPKGESLSVSIAAASIVAKVARDRLMERMDVFVPQYYLAEHKGYATAKHKAALAKQGASAIHRMTFLKKENVVGAYEDREGQISLC